MTQQELETTITSLKNEYLALNGIYFNYISIGNITSSLRIKDSLIAVNLYLKILDYYSNIGDKDISPIASDDIDIIIAEADKLLDTYNLYYESR